MSSNPAGLVTPRLDIPPRERRHASRVWTDLQVGMLLNGFSHPCRAVDLSLTGMLVELTKALASQAPQLIGTYELHVNPSQILTIKARTVWQHGAMLAVCFLCLAEEDRLAISEAVEAAARRLVGDVERLDLAEIRDRLDDMIPLRASR